MPWPLSQDYNEAIQTPTQCFVDPELRQGEAVTNALGLPVPCSGNFADVYAVVAGQRKWAVKCFTRQIPGLQERYQQISRHLEKGKPSFIVDFTFLDRGIEVNGNWYPILKMQWVEGFTLNEFVKNNLDKPQVLDSLCQLWVKLARRLREANIAHCDLQHGNVLLVPGNKAGSLHVRLVDYDGMCVPALTLLKSIEVGHPSYQHPQRLREGIYSLEVDRFSHLVIYTALRALMVGGKPLWDRYDNGDNLLFNQADFEAPAKSSLFYGLLKLDDPTVRFLAEQMIDAVRKPLDQTPLLEELVAVTQPPPAVAAPPKDEVNLGPSAGGGGRLATAARTQGKPEPQGLAMVRWGILVGLLGLAVVGGVLVATRERPETPPVAIGPVAMAADKSTETKPVPVVMATQKTTETVVIDPKGTPKVQPSALPPRFTNSLGMEFALVPKGKSWLGGGSGKPGDKDVEIPHDFYLGVYEVTQEEWLAVTGWNPSYFSRNGHRKESVKNVPDAELKRFPVEFVSWDDAQSFLTQLNRRVKEAGWSYRLPTEVEWEFACRGGPLEDPSESAFDFYLEKPIKMLEPGKATPPIRAPSIRPPSIRPSPKASTVRKANEMLLHGKANFGAGRPCKVGSYAPNRLGLYDMHGNVRELCDDAFKDDPKWGTWRVMRGGCYASEGSLCRASFRDGVPPVGHGYNIGLRVARVPVAQGPKPDQAAPPSPAISLALQQMISRLEKGSEDEKLKAIDDLAKLQSAARPAARALCEAAVSPSQAVARNAILALETVCPELKKPVFILLVDSEAANNLQASDSLAQMEAQARPALAVLLHQIKKCQKDMKDRARWSTNTKDRTNWDAKTLEQVIVRHMNSIARVAPEDPQVVQTIIDLTNFIPFATLPGAPKKGWPAVTTTPFRQTGLVLLGGLAEAHPAHRKTILPTLVALLYQAAEATKSKNQFQVVQALKELENAASAISRCGPEGAAVLAKDIVSIQRDLQFHPSQKVRDQAEVLSKFRGEKSTK